MAAVDAEAAPKRASMKTVVIASSAGTAFEWYDFFVFGTLTTIISRTFFTGLDETAGVLAALALFGAAYFFRPFGALIFGRLGDVVGRKGAFLITVSLMGGATFAIGLLPTFNQIGVLAPILLILMRILQGTALGGEYGGAAVYVAEHSEPEKRGWHTGWIQTSAAFGLVGALAVILVTRTILGEEAFAAWGWRIPFLASSALLAISVWMRMKLSESPAFKAMKEAGEESKAPFSEAFGQWKNLKLVLIILFGMMSAQGAFWYTAFFYTQTFMERFLKVEPTVSNALIMTITVISAPLYVFFAWLSDKVGRKWVMWFGMLLGVAIIFPGFHGMAKFANPALVQAQANTPIVVMADPADCHFQLDIIGKAKFLSSCDIAKNTLTNAGVSYTVQPASAGDLAQVHIGQTVLPSLSGAGAAPDQIAAGKAEFETAVKDALADAGYPLKAARDQMNIPGLLAVLILFVIAATALYGPMAASLVEMFPTRIRYTALSFPYHLGIGWIGGFVPAVAFAIATATGNIYAGLWYPAFFTGLSVVLCFFLVPETRGRPLD